MGQPRPCGIRRAVSNPHTQWRHYAAPLPRLNQFVEESRLSTRVGSWVSSVAMLLLLASPVGCGGDDGNDNDGEERPRPVAGTFVGKLRGSDGSVAVVAAPPANGENRRKVSALVCDAQRTCAWFTGTASGNSVVVKSGSEGQAEIQLRGKAASGSVELPGGAAERYNAREAAATSGLYDLTVSRSGEVSGASAAGVGLTGQLTLPPPGTGRLKLADSTRIKLDVTEGNAGDRPGLQAGQLRLIVLPDGEAIGAGKSLGGNGDTAFVVHSAPK